MKGRAFNASRFTCRFAEKLPVSGARVTILRWVVTDTIASFKMNSFSWGGIEALFSPALYICSVSPHSSLRSQFSSSSSCYSALWPHSSAIKRKSKRRRNLRLRRDPYFRLGNTAAVTAGPIARCCPFAVSVRFRPSFSGESLFSISSVFVFFCFCFWVLGIFAMFRWVVPGRSGGGTRCNI